MKKLFVLFTLFIVLSIKILAQIDSNSFEIFYMSSAPTFHYGKSENFILWLYQNIEYPKSALKDSLSGKVIARFLIDPIGAVKNIEIIKGVRNDLDSAVIKVLYASPCWTPAKQGNESIAVPFFVRVEFNIQDPDFKNKIILFSKQLKIKKN